MARHRVEVVDALGQPVRPEAYSDAFRRLCRAADVPVIRLHSVRHSLAFSLHSLGVPPAARQRCSVTRLTCT